MLKIAVTGLVAMKYRLQAVRLGNAIISCILGEPITNIGSTLRKSGGNALREATIDASGLCIAGWRNVTSSVVIPTYTSEPVGAMYCNAPLIECLFPVASVMI